MLLRSHVLGDDDSSPCIGARQTLLRLYHICFHYCRRFCPHGKASFHPQLLAFCPRIAKQQPSFEECPSQVVHFRTRATSILTRAVYCSVGKFYNPISYPHRLNSSAIGLPKAEFEILAIIRVHVKRGIMGSVQPVSETDGQLRRNKAPGTWRQQMIRTGKTLDNDFVQVGALVDLITMSRF